jgi:hypothetical protein
MLFEYNNHNCALDLENGQNSWIVFFFLNKEKDTGDRWSFSLLIWKEGVDDPINEKIG